MTPKNKVPQFAALYEPEKTTGRGNKGVALQIAEKTGLSKDTV